MQLQRVQHFNALSPRHTPHATRPCCYLLSTVAVMHTRPRSLKGAAWERHTGMARTVAWGRITLRPEKQTPGGKSELEMALRLNHFIWLTRWMHKNSLPSFRFNFLCWGPRQSFHFVTFQPESHLLHKSIQFVINFKTFHFILILMPAKACRRRSFFPLTSPSPGLPQEINLILIK